MVMFADLVDEVDFATRVAAFVSVAPDAQPDTVCTAVLAEWHTLNDTQKTGLVDLYQALEAEKGLVIPEVIDAIRRHPLNR